MERIIVKEVDSAAIAWRARQLLADHQRGIHVRTDQLFSRLLVLQWLSAICVAELLSPRQWAGVIPQTHVHVIAAIALGGVIILLPELLAHFRPGRFLTRSVIALGQMLMGALLIHLTGGRIETHFHVFGSLALLAFYRDWRVLVLASAVVALDHLVRGMVWPQSVYGTDSGAAWRWLEHAGWVLFIDIFLIWSCLQGVREMTAIAERQAESEATGARIERTVAERTAELWEQAECMRELTQQLQASEARMREAKEAAETANRSKGQFLANMSHEIRTPMNAILGMTQLVIDSELSAEQLECLNAVKTSADALLGIINDILDFSKIEAGKLDLESIPFSLSEVLNDTLRVFLWRARDKGLRLNVRREPDVPDRLQGDPGRLRQILVNLVGNGIKFTDRGEVTAWVEPAPEGEGEGNARLHFSVRDTGIGIPADKQSAIFRAFEQADGSTTRKYGGTGLGLAITKRLVEMMGGRLWVESCLGRGSTFHFTAVFALPPAEMPLVPPEVNQALSPECELKDLHVLLVEDGVINQKLAIRLLEKKGHRVTLACNGKEALALVEKHDFDLVLMDLQMPEMGGLEATATIREGEKGTDRHIPIIAMTAHALRGDEERCIRSGMDGYVSKPIQTDRLWQVMAQVLSQASPGTVSPASDAKNVLDEDALLERCGGDVEMKRELIQHYLSEYPSQLTAIRSAISAHEPKQLEAVAHQLKGTSANFGAERVVAAALRLEEMGSTGAFQEAGIVCRELEDALTELHDALSPSVAAGADC